MSQASCQKSSFPILLHGSTSLNSLHIRPFVRHNLEQVLGKYITKASKSLAFAFQIGITLLDQFHKFSGVDIWIPSFVNVLDDFWGHLRR